MAYYEGFIVAVPQANKEAYRQHAEEAFAFLAEFGVARHVEAWESDVPDGAVTDFRKAVQAKKDEAIVFSWFEYPSREVRQAAGEKMMTDPRIAEMMATMPFDGKRMVYGGFAPLLDQGAPGGRYVDGFVVPVPEGNRDRYLELANAAAANFRKHGAHRLVEGWGDDLPDGTVTDFRGAVKAADGENVVFSWAEWPDKQTRDAAWAKMMADPEMQPDHANMPFDGMRMFWGGFEIILDRTAPGKEAP